MLANTETRTPVSLIARSLENATRAELDQVRKDWLLSAYSNGTFERLDTLALVYGHLIPNPRRDHIAEIVTPLNPDGRDGENVRMYYFYHTGNYVPALKSFDIIRTWIIFVGGELTFYEGGAPRVWHGGGRAVCYFRHYKSFGGITYRNADGDDFFIVPGPWIDRLLDYSVKAQAVVDAEAAAREEEERKKLYNKLCIDLLS